FEEGFASYCGVRYAIGVASGTDALELALLALGIGKGDGVITTPFTFIATVEAIVSVGAKPIFIDIDLNTYNIDTEKIKETIKTKRGDLNIKAMVPVHLYGQSCDMDTIMRIAKKYNLKVIEDCAQAVGAEYKNRKVGSFGDCGCFSFFPSKNLSTYGDGGMVVTNDKKVAENLRMLRSHGARDKYHHVIKGKNSRLDELHAAVLHVKLKYIDKWNNERRRIAGVYDRLFHQNKLGSLLISPKESPDRKHIFHIYAIRIRERDKLHLFLKEHDITTLMHYPIPLHMEEVYKYMGYKKGDFPNAEVAATSVLSLPMYPELELREIKYVVDTIKQFCNSRNI
ncbi:MAG: DegT/DnrJ/EryC1/StrS family aminotransferase, partial [Candidatus Omnitrophica bacterium]|nr:DegT/DnrJ/EryC1/StrS family aminotransferase [Candidatus Omnitrophota bacterium]